MTIFDDAINIIGRVTGGIQQLGIPVVSDIFGVVDNILDTIQLKVDAVIATLEDVIKSGDISSIVSSVVETFTDEIITPLTNTFEDLIIEPIKDSFEEYIIQPITTFISEDIIKGLLNSLQAEEWT